MPIRPHGFAYYTTHPGFPDSANNPLGRWAGHARVFNDTDTPGEHDCGDNCRYDDDDEEYDCDYIPAWFHDPADHRIAALAYQTACEFRPWSNQPNPTALLPHIAHVCHLPSSLAAADAIMDGYRRCLGYDGTEIGNAREYASSLKADLGITDSTAPFWMYQAWLTGIDWWAQRSFFESPAPLDDAALGCRCRGPHCIECNPNGPPGDCRCDLCIAQYQDDLSAPDDWAGLPIMPSIQRDRCRFGIEVEFNVNRVRDSERIRNQISRSLTMQGVPCLDTSYTHEVVRYWKMTTDASVTGGEVVSPVLAGDEASIDTVREVLRIVKSHGGETGRNVGMHVHLDVTPFEARQLKALAYNLQALEMFLAGYVPKWRYDGTNGHVGLINERSWEEIHQWIAQVSPRHRDRTRSNRESSSPVGRYRSFNFNSLLTYGTVEVRLLGHTLNTAKVRTWIRVLQAIMEASRRRNHIAGGADILQWLARYGLEEEHRERYLEVVQQRNMTEHLVARSLVAA